MRLLITFATALLLTVFTLPTLAQEPQTTPAVRVRIVTQDCGAIFKATLNAEFVELSYDAEQNTWVELPGAIYPLATCDLTSKQFMILHEHPESGRKFLFLMGAGGSHDIVSVSELIPTNTPKRRQ